jgi:hypothetical protein
MKKINKIINIALIFMLGWAFLCSDLTYALRPALLFNGLSKKGSDIPTENLQSDIDSVNIGMNGVAGLAGGELMKYFAMTTKASLQVSGFPDIPDSLIKSSAGRFTIRKGNILIRSDNERDLDGVDAFLHIAGRPVHYADKELAPNIFAVDVIGSAMVALSAYAENIKRRDRHELGPLRMIMFSSISSVWIDNYIKRISASGNHEESEAGSDLTEWLKQATKEFLEYTEAYYEGRTEVNPEAFVNSYLGKSGGLIEENWKSLIITGFPNC